MNENTKRLLWVVGGLLVLQLVVVPILGWQSRVVEDLERELLVLADREALIREETELEEELKQRQQAVLALSPYAFAAGPSDTLEIQRWVANSLEEYNLSLRQFQWGAKADAASISSVRARVEIRGGFFNLLFWTTSLQISDPWVSVVALKSSRDTRRGGSAEIFTSTLTLQFLLKEPPA